ncbi:putative metal-binding motif-containing protein [Myxococcota bacterium]
MKATDELCNGTDDDCDDAIDEGAVDTTTWYADGDDDGYGDPDVSQVACDQPDGYLADDTDCDDTSDAVFPGAEELCNTVDDDCDDAIDEGAVDVRTWYADADDDGYGDPDVSQVACNQPGGYVADDTDCDDVTTSVHPGAIEDCNGVDDDCNLGVAPLPLPSAIQARAIGPASCQWTTLQPRMIGICVTASTTIATATRTRTTWISPTG